MVVFEICNGAKVEKQIPYSACLRQVGMTSMISPCQEGKLEEPGIDLPGANLLIAGDMPLGAGLSSSASLEVAACDAFLAMSNAKLDAAEMARPCQRAENEYVGARCGIMDQFVSVHGKKDH